MKNQPKIKLIPSLNDKLIDYTSLAIIIFLFVFTFISYKGLPEKIPTHVGFSGQPDKYGSKATLWLLPIIETFMFLGLYSLNKVPHLFNYMVEITEENAERQYKISTRMMRWINLCTVLLFAVIQVEIVLSANGKNTSGGLAALFFCLLTFIIIFIFARKSKRQK